MGGVLDLAFALDVDVVWLTSEYAEAAGLPARLGTGLVEHPWMAAGDGYDIRGRMADPPCRVLRPWLVGWPLPNHSQRRRAEIAIAPLVDDAWAGLDAQDLHRELQAYTAAIGEPFTRTAATTGTRLMQSSHSGRRGIKVTGRGDAPHLEHIGALEMPFAWIRPLSGQERARKWVRAYDRNGQYLAACSSLSLGVGACEYRARPAFDKDTPGYWNARLGQLPDCLPDPFRTAQSLRTSPGEPAAGPAWYTTPTIALAEQLGVLERIDEAWTWPDHHQWLAPWYRRLRDARLELLDGHPSALRALKNAVNKSLGSLAGRHATGASLYRPDWYDAVKATARANLYRRLVKVSHAGAHPFAVDVDACFFAVDGDGPPAEIPIGQGLGDFKPYGAVPMARALAIVDGARSPQRALRELAEACRV